MADRSVCKIEGCGKPQSRRGWCHMHYSRWYRGQDMLAPIKAARSGEPIRWIKQNYLFDGNECLDWPFGKSKDGYGAVRWGGVQMRASRAMCIEAHGEPPAREYECAHSCGKGHEGCVNPKHLRWATPLENSADTFVHGTNTAGERNAAAKLSRDNVIAIRSLKGRMKQADIAIRFGVAQTTVGRILSRATWADCR